MELEDKKFSCVCGSEVKEANRKAHEKTKKHTNFQLSHPNGFNNVMTMINLPVPKQPKKYQPRPKPIQEDGVNEDGYADEDDLDDNGLDDEDGEGWEEDVSALLEAMNSKLDRLISDQKNNINKTVIDIGFLVNPVLNTINDRLTRMEQSRLSADQLSTGRQSLCMDPPASSTYWINDKCTPRN